jgi:hypothetical protein
MENHMRIKTTLLTALAVSGLILFSTTGAEADAWNKKTNLTVNQTIEVPGAILQPGKYVVKLVDSQSNRHIVRFLNEREDRVISTVIAIPNWRMKPTGDTEFAWYETRQGEPPALRAWFYPGDNFGQEFVYPKRQGGELATRIGSDIPTAENDETVAVREEPVQPEPAPTRRESPPEPLIAQAREPQPPPSQPEPQQRPRPEVERQTAASPPADDESLPKTAGPAPLLALLGLISMFSAFTLRRARKS